MDLFVQLIPMDCQLFPVFRRHGGLMVEWSHHHRSPSTAVFMSTLFVSSSTAELQAQQSFTTLELETPRKTFRTPHLILELFTTEKKLLSFEMAT
jgi:hypothetical protein